jgi:hypothetical protein
MLLRSTGTSILGAGRRVAQIDPQRAEAVLVAQGRHPLIARVLAWGGWRAAEHISRHDAERIGREIGVIQ